MSSRAVYTEASHSEILCRGLSRPVFRELGDSENGAGQSLPQHRFLLIKCVNGHSFLQNQVAAAMTVCYNQSMELDSAEGNRESALALFMIASVLCDLFSAQMDMAAEGEQRGRKVFLVFSAEVCSVCMIAVIAGILS